MGNLINVGLEAFAVADARHEFPGQRITASIPRVSEEVYRALLFGLPSETNLTVYSTREILDRPDETDEVAKKSVAFQQLPQLPLLRTGNRFLVLPVNRFLQREVYPRVVTRKKHDLIIYTYHFPWGLESISAREMWVALDFYLFRSAPLQWAAHLQRLKASRQLSLLCISEATARDAQEFLGIPRDRLAVAHLGVDHEIFNLNVSADKSLLSSCKLPLEEFVLYVGAWYGRKNVRTLLAAMEIVNRGKSDPVTLVLAGFPGQPASATEKSEFLAAIESGHTPVSIVRDLSDYQLAALYRRCKVLVHPSLFEGFGLTVLEAMACGTPVICGHHSSLIEVSGGAAIELDDLLDSAALAEAIQNVCFRGDLAEGMRQKGVIQAAKFKWETFACQTNAFVQKTLDA